MSIILINDELFMNNAQYTTCRVLNSEYDQILRLTLIVIFYVRCADHYKFLSHI